MKGSHSQLTITTTTDEATGDVKPLFSFPVQICKATGSDDPSFDRATPHGSEYATVYRDKITGEVFEYADLIRGVRTGDSFATIKPDQIKAIEEEVSMEDMRVVRSLPLDEVPMDRASGRYYLQAPAKGGSHTHYKLTFEALRARPKKGKKAARPAMALEVKYTSRTRQKLGVVFADEERGCLTLIQLVFAAELREPDEVVLAPQTATVEAKQIDMARQVIEGLAVSADDYEEPVDEVIEKKRDLIAAAADGKVIEVTEPVSEATTVAADELSDVLEASLAPAA